MQKRRRKETNRLARRRTAPKEHRRSSPNNPTKARLLSSIILRGQKGHRHETARDRLQGPESILALSTFQDGRHSNSPGRGSTGQLSDSVGFYGCIFPSAHQHSVPSTTTSQHSLEKLGYSVSGASIRPFHSSKNMDKADARAGETPSRERLQNGCLSGRSAICERFVRGSQGTDPTSPGVLSVTGFSDQPEEVSLQADSTSRLSRFHHRHSEDGVVHASTQTTSGAARGSPTLPSPVHHSSPDGQIRGSHDGSSASDHPGPTQSEIVTTVDFEVDETTQGQMGQTSSPVRDGATGSEVVVQRGQSVERSLDAPTSGRLDVDDRCVQASVRRFSDQERRDDRPGLRAIPITSGTPFDKCQRTSSNLVPDPQVAGGSVGHHSGGRVRQFHRSGLHSELWQSSPSAEQDCTTPMAMVPEEAHISNSHPPPGPSQCRGRCFVPNQQFFVATASGGVPAGLREDTGSFDRSFRVEGGSSPATILQQVPVSSGRGHRCFTSTLAERGDLVGSSPPDPDRQGSREATSLPGNPLIADTPMAIGSLVPSLERPLPGATTPSPADAEPISRPGCVATPMAGVPMESGCLDFIQQSLSEQGVGSSTTEAVLASFKRSQKQYELAWGRWLEFCAQSGKSPRALDPTALAAFAVSLCQGTAGVSPSTAANYTSLLSSIHSAADAAAPQGGLLARTLRGLNVRNPSQRTRYKEIWDADKLLAFIEFKYPDNSRLDESTLRQKTAALLALSIFGRPSELFAL